MKPNKRIWELRSSTVCKVVGMALFLKDLQRIARKFGISGNDPLMDEEFALHSTVIQLCSRDNPVSRHTEKLIEKRFLIHGKRVPLDDPAGTIRAVRETPQDLQAPLWAILWGLATRGRLADEKIETALFGTIHMMEHRLVRDHWKSLNSPGDEGAQEDDKDNVILSLKREILDTQWANRKLEKISEYLRNQVESSPSLQPVSAAFSDPDISTARPCQCAKNQKISNLKALLAEAKYCNYELEAENAQLKGEIQGLFEELRRYEKDLPDKQFPDVHIAGRDDEGLTGKKITLVGGIESLECHYRQVVESVGGAVLSSRRSLPRRRVRSGGLYPGSRPRGLSGGGEQPQCRQVGQEDL